MPPSPAGREDLVELVDDLVDRRRIAPIIQLTGPGGSGKAEILQYLKNRYSKAAPVASITLSDLRTNTTYGLISLIHGKLTRFVDRRRFGRLRLPRTGLALAVREGERSLPPDVTRAVVRREFLTRPPRPPDVRAVPPDGRLGAVLQWIALGLHAAVFVRRYRARLPSFARRVLSPGDDACWRWYEGVGGPMLVDGGREFAKRIDDVLVDMVVQDRESRARLSIHDPPHSEPPDPDLRHRLDDLLLAAFLADVCAAYRRRRYRRVRCVLLIGNVDLLTAESNRSLATGRAVRGRPDGDGGLLERLMKLEQDCCRHRPRRGRSAGSTLHPPLLVVASNQDGPLPTTRESPRTQYGDWRSAADLAPLTLPMNCLSWADSIAFLNHLAHGTDSEETDLQPLQAAEIYSASRGHPHAMSIILREEDLSLENRGAGTPARAVLSRPEIENELLSRFLQRFPETRGVRREAIGVLSVLANANRIDTGVLTELLPLCDTISERDPGPLLGRLRRYSFMSDLAVDDSRSEDGHVLVMHPTLRDVLVRRLVRADEESFQEVHRRLAGRSAPDGARPDDVDHLYHRLALGDVTGVAQALDRRREETDDDRACSLALRSICSAPGFHEYATDDPSSVASVLVSMWALESSTSVAEWKAELVREAIADLPTLERTAGGP